MERPIFQPVGTPVEELDTPALVIALDVMDRIDGAVGRLADHPGSGRPGRISGTRELAIPNLHYIVAYRIRRERVQILRVLHAARRWPGRA